MSLTNNLDLPRFFLKKNLEFELGDRASTLGAAFVLGLSIADGLTEEQGCKQSTIRAGGPCCVKMVFALLTKVIVVYVRLFIISIGKPGLQKTLLRLLKGLLGTHANSQKPL